MKSKTILLVEDETDVMLANQEYMLMKGMNVLCADTIAEATQILDDNNPDIILLDVMLPDGNGIDFIDNIKEKTAVPVLFLTCLSDSDNVIRGLIKGGSDYIRKPYDMDELYARIVANLRKEDEVRERAVKIDIGDIHMDTQTRRVLVGGQEKYITPIQFNILLYLAKNLDRVISGKEIYKEVWGIEDAKISSNVRIQIYELRKNLGMPKDNDPERYPYLDTIFGKGYMLATKER
ncbi:DNA-binding response OmpR family regulator [Lachnospiraceae bacterium PF1-22]|uniref:response regulator transcription factor n=1 Tax=Ohessyouella blattaphilus TaxID=2949333 RepID=UPI003E2D4BF3